MAARSRTAAAPARSVADPDDGAAAQATVAEAVADALANIDPKILRGPIPASTS